LSGVQYHVFPYDPPGEAVMDWSQAGGAGGHFEVGTVSNTTLACLTHSLDYIQRIGVANIQSHAQALVRRLQKEMPRFGFEPMTPRDSVSPIVAFAKKDTRETSERLRRATVDIAVYPHRVRISPSVYNDQADIDKLLEALS